MSQFVIFITILFTFLIANQVYGLNFYPQENIDKYTSFSGLNDNKGFL